MTYKQLQTEKYKSFESRNQQWREGQARFILHHFLKISLDSNIVDLGCGDGVGLMYFKKLGFKNITGVEFCEDKARKAKTYGYPILETDMHDLSVIPTSSIDIVYSSHSLEHTYDPCRVLKEIKRILKPNGEVFLVLPYPDIGPEDAHCGKFLLGTNHNDDAKILQQVLELNGFTILAKSFDSFREPEVWMHLKNE